MAQIEKSEFATQIGSLKVRLQKTWMAGDYDRFSRYMEAGARLYYEHLDIAPGARVLDVACGSGQLALMASRDGFDTIGVDIAENLIDRARERAAAEHLNVHFEVGDAEALTFPDGSFDMVVSLIGAMFAPRPELVAREFLRVCAPGGTIAMANWTASGFVGQMFKTIAQFIAPSNMPSPLLWGEEEIVRERFGASVFRLNLIRRAYRFSYPFPPSEVVDVFRLYYGPATLAFASLDAAGAQALHRELESLWSAHNRAKDRVTIVDAEYLDVVATRA
jgi:SAM-dependent methyltransferase